MALIKNILFYLILILFFIILFLSHHVIVKHKEDQNCETKKINKLIFD